MPTQATPTPGQEGSVEAVQSSIAQAQATLDFAAGTAPAYRLDDSTAGCRHLAGGTEELRLSARNLWEYSPVNNPDGFFGLLILKLVGLLITTIALTQGAPFWFDLLRRLTRGGNG